MSGNGRGAGGGADARQQLGVLREELRKQRTVRVVSMVVALVIVIAYALAFVSMFKRGLNPEQLAVELRTELQSSKTQESLRSALSRVYNDVRPVYIDELKKRDLVGKLRPVLTEELQTLAKEVGPVYLDEFKRTVSESDLAPLFAEQLRTLVSDVGSVYAEEVKKQLLEGDLWGLVQGELSQLVSEVGPAYMGVLTEKVGEGELAPVLMESLADLAGQVAPVYLDGLRELTMELELMPAFTDAMTGVAPDIADAYRREFSRIAPEVFDAVKAAHSDLLTNLSGTTEIWLKDTVRSSLERNSEYVGAKTGLTPDGVEATLANVVVGVEGALVNVVRQRSDNWQADLTAIQEMLDSIPPAKEQDPDRLVDELVYVSLHLVNAHLDKVLPDFDDTLDW